MPLLHRRAVFGLLAAVPLAAALPAFADEAPFLKPGAVDLVAILPPPPDAETTKAELAAFHAFEKVRTQAEAEHATADDDESIFRFLAGMGVELDPKTFPQTDRFSQRLQATEAEFVDPAKKVFARPRPHIADPTIKPLVPLSKSGAYPSGHATLGLLYGIALAKMMPEKKAAFFARALDYGHSRYVVGIHYASDVEASKMAAPAIAGALLNDPEFLQALEPVKAELRPALGLN